MENKKLAIKGHKTRGKEVIEIFEMLGGKNNLLEGKDTRCFYYIHADNNHIRLGHAEFCNTKNFIIFTLEEFLEKYPYKVEDKVKTIYGKIGNVSKCKWDADNNCMMYKLDTSVYNDSFYFAHELIPYKEEIKAEDHTEIYTDTSIVDDSKTDIIINGEKLIAPNGYTIGNATKNGNSLIVEYIKNKPQYPKTYEECCQITEKVAKTTHELDIAYNPNLIYDFQKLLICRDAYWKIAGEQMGLSEPWKPDWYDEYEYKFVIICSRNDIIEETYYIRNAILAFPTEEMRDAFFENFKDLIEKCKEFL